MRSYASYRATRRARGGPADAREPRRGRRQPAEPQPVGREVRVDRRARHRGRIAAGRASRAGHDHPRARHDARARPPGRWVTPVRRDTPAPVLDPPSPSRPVRVKPSRRAARRRRGSPRGGREPPSLLECPRLACDVDRRDESRTAPSAHTRPRRAASAGPDPARLQVRGGSQDRRPGRRVLPRRVKD